MKHFSDISWFLLAKNRAPGFSRQYDAVSKNRSWKTLTIIITVIYFPAERQSLLLLPAQLCLWYMNFGCFWCLKWSSWSDCMVSLTAERAEIFLLMDWKLQLLKPSFFNLRMHSAYILFDHVYIYTYIYEFPPHEQKLIK